MKVVIIFLLGLGLLACSKYKVHEKKLPGSWKLYQVRIEDGEGFVFYDSLATGWFLIDGAKLNGKANYSYNYFGLYTVSDSVAFSQSNCSLSADGESLFIERSTDTLHAKIIMLTNKQLTFEYYDQIQYRLKRFSCTKQ